MINNLSCLNFLFFLASKQAILYINQHKGILHPNQEGTRGRNHITKPATTTAQQPELKTTRSTAVP